LGEDAEHRRIGICDPTSKDETAHEDYDAGEKTLEKIEDADCADAIKVEDRSTPRYVRGLCKLLKTRLRRLRLVSCMKSSVLKWV